MLGNKQSAKLFLYFCALVVPSTKCSFQKRFAKIHPQTIILWGNVTVHFKQSLRNAFNVSNYLFSTISQTNIKFSLITEDHSAPVLNSS